MTKKKQISETKKATSFGLVIFTLSLAQFIMSVDTTIMNVSIPTLVEDLDTTVSGVQGAITLYALVMASLMLIGGKLGEVYGRKKIFQIGLVIFSIGTTITAFSSNIYMLMFGWSILEGIGAALMMPAMMALISINFQGKQRVAALGIVAAVAGAAVAVGPILGGALSTYATWRYAFIGELFIAIPALLLTKVIYDSSVENKEKLDVKGAIIVASGLGLFVFGVLQATNYGWIRATQPFVLAGREIDLFGLSIVPFISGLGLILCWYFLRYQKQRKEAKKSFLLNIDLLKIISLKSGLSVVLITQLVLAGIMFIMPLFLQLVLGYSAMKSGVALLPVSLSLIMASVFGQKFLSKKLPIQNVRLGQLLMLFGIIAIYFSIGNDTNTVDLIIPFVLLGSGIGLIFPFIQTIVLGSASDRDSSQVSGLNYTAQQLGMSLGTAVIGSVLLLSLGNIFVKGLENSSAFDQALVEQNKVEISSGVQFVSNDDLEVALASSDLSETQQEVLFQINSDSRLVALKSSLIVTGIFLLIGFTASNKIRDFLELTGENKVNTAYGKE